MMTESDAVLVLRALWSATTAITEDENPASDECRYCHAEEYPADEQGERVGWSAENIAQYLIEHESWCPSSLIDHAFDGMDDQVVERVRKALMGITLNGADSPF